MSSISYQLLGQPRSIDDCLCFIDQHAASEVRISTRINNIAQQPFCITQFIIGIDLQDADRPRQAEWICEGYLQNAKASAKDEIHQQAKAKLTSLIEQIRGCGHQVIDDSNAFALASEEPSP